MKAKKIYVLCTDWMCFYTLLLPVRPYQSEIAEGGPAMLLGSETYIGLKNTYWVEHGLALSAPTVLHSGLRALDSINPEAA